MMVTECAVMSYTFSPADGDPAVPPLDVATGFLSGDLNTTTSGMTKLTGCAVRGPIFAIFSTCWDVFTGQEKKKTRLLVMCACCVHCLKIYLA